MASNGIEGNELAVGTIIASVISGSVLLGRELVVRLFGRRRDGADTTKSITEAAETAVDMAIHQLEVSDRRLHDALEEVEQLRDEREALRAEIAELRAEQP